MFFFKHVLDLENCVLGEAILLNGKRKGSKLSQVWTSYHFSWSPHSTRWNDGNAVGLATFAFSESQCRYKSSRGWPGPGGRALLAQGTVQGPQVLQWHPSLTPEPPHPVFWLVICTKKQCYFSVVSFYFSSRLLYENLWKIFEKRSVFQ